jgi:hypothetical protein
MEAGLLMARYSFNVVSTWREGGTRPVVWHRAPQAFDGPADEFAQAMLGDVLAGDPSLDGVLVVINVWDGDQPGVGVASRIAAQAVRNPEEPQPSNEISVDYSHYYVAPVADDRIDDPITDPGWALSVGAGLVVPGEGPVLEIHTGHQWGYITLQVSQHDHEPDLDLAGWEVAEQVTIRPEKPMGVCDWNWIWYDRYTDLTGELAAEYLTIRVSARGRDANFSLRGRPADRAEEHHRIQIWPADGPAPRQVLKRDQTSRYWEGAGHLDPP